MSIDFDFDADFDAEADEFAFEQAEAAFEAFMAEQAEELDHEAFLAWCEDNEVDPEAEKSRNDYTDYLVGMAEDAAEDAAWRRGC